MLPTATPASTDAFCHGSEIRQFHAIKVQNQNGLGIAEDPTQDSYTLGAWSNRVMEDEGLMDAKKARALGSLREILASEDKAGEDSSSHNAVGFVHGTGRGAFESGNGDEKRYLVQRWAGGTLCDKTGVERKVEVQVRLSHLPSCLLSQLPLHLLILSPIRTAFAASVPLQFAVDRQDLFHPRDGHLRVRRRHTHASAVRRADLCRQCWRGRYRGPRAPQEGRERHRVPTGRAGRAAQAVSVESSGKCTSSARCGCLCVGAGRGTEGKQAQGGVEPAGQASARCSSYRGKRTVSTVGSTLLAQSLIRIIHQLNSQAQDVSGKQATGPSFDPLPPQPASRDTADSNQQLGQPSLETMGDGDMEEAIDFILTIDPETGEVRVEAEDGSDSRPVLAADQAAAGEGQPQQGWGADGGTAPELLGGQALDSLLDRLQASIARTLDTLGQAHAEGAPAADAQDRGREPATPPPVNEREPVGAGDGAAKGVAKQGKTDQQLSRLTRSGRGAQHHKNVAKQYIENQLKKQRGGAAAGRVAGGAGHPVGSPAQQQQLGSAQHRLLKQAFAAGAPWQEAEEDKERKDAPAQPEQRGQVQAPMPARARRDEL